ncbi:hypothetical protein C8A05DRAFT_19829 [Staphylotrichum tortipilum]|uniref:Uncharacterized protein n=1 Tax=Staphylotrichum tortipilum TaxID=2831512 RepID=A0AAN6RNW7_9PEZI|nr:hypothetical protein C8A05DRAFT_19829 [Staphylotrichum longicolle]
MAETADNCSPSGARVAPVSRSSAKLTSAGEVITILGLVERVAVEFRNYKDAPEDFQNLGVELDLLRSTLRHVLPLRPKDNDERLTLNKVRAIAAHCLQPLQAMADKLRAREGSRKKNMLERP